MLKFDHGAFYVGVWFLAVGSAVVLIPYAFKLISKFTGSGTYSSEIMDSHNCWN